MVVDGKKKRRKTKVKEKITLILKITSLKFIFTIREL